MFEQKFAKEAELYLPVKAFLEARGYVVKGEVKSCDILAAKDELYIIIELKLSYNLKLVFQAVERQDSCDNVMIAIPDYAFETRKKQILKLMKKLNVGILTISKRPSGLVVKEELALNELSSFVDEELEREFSERSFDLSPSTNIVPYTVTAYKEKAIALAVLLSLNDEMSIKELKALTAIENVQPILYNNYDGFFERTKRGVYRLTAVGLEKLQKYPQLVEFYSNKFRGSKC